MEPTTLPRTAQSGSGRMDPPAVLGFPTSYDAVMNVYVAWCAACELETSGWCGGCETCDRIAVYPLIHNCTPAIPAEPLLPKKGD